MSSLGGIATAQFRASDRELRLIPGSSDDPPTVARANSLFFLSTPRIDDLHVVLDWTP